MTEVVLVNERDEPIGTAEKLSAHRNGGRLHRAVSVFVFNSRGELLLQRRALTKYHFRGLWANTCCTHPVPGESTIDAACARLKLEMGLTAPLMPAGSFIYAATDTESTLTERELDHLFVGSCDDPPDPNPLEVCEWAYRGAAELERDMDLNPSIYAPWLKPAIDALREGSHWPARQADA